MSSNIFNTVNSVSQLHISPKAQGLSKKMIQVRSKTPVAGNWSTVSLMDFEFQVSGNQWFCPSESYFIIDATLTNGNASIIAAATGWALNGFSALFANAKHHINETLVSESYHPAQEDTAIKRLSLSTAARNTVGSAQSLQPLQTDRMTAATEAKRKTYYYQPKMLSIFNYQGERDNSFEICR